MLQAKQQGRCGTATRGPRCGARLVRNDRCSVRPTATRAVLMSLILAAWIGGRPVLASPPPDARQELSAAITEFQTLAERTLEAGDLPRWADPEGARVLARVWDRQRILGTSPYVAADVPVLLGIVDQWNKISKTYLLFTAKPGTVPNTAVTTIRYQNELARGVDALMHAMAAVAEAIVPFWESLPDKDHTTVRRAGIQNIRVGLVQTLQEVLTTMRLQNFHADNRRILALAIVETAGIISRSLSEADRTAMAAQVTATIQALPEEEGDWLIPALAPFSQPGCTGLCAIN
ncbi:hypothetical protein NS230_09505 [Methylobacterium indicum]|nr:hypothetical protein NS229_19970 [Methylobacterium indicum]KTS52499.1 hypothetical protein NS230_09505 [Methylobacterium indicum]